MIFNFEKFKRIAVKAYRKVDNPIFDLEEVLIIFEWYFYRYEQMRREPHPPIRTEQVERLIEEMPYCEGMSGDLLELYPEDYAAMIEQYFKTRYRNCDYNINHFFSGQIRSIKLYETCKNLSLN